MKTMTKRIVSAALAVMMAVCVLASAVPTKAFAAAPTGTLTVTSTNAEFNGKEVKIWKMFDATAGAGDAVGYQLTKEWEPFFKSTNLSDFADGGLTGAKLSQKAYEYVSALKQDDTKVAGFAKKAAAWAKDVNNNVSATASVNAQANPAGDKYVATFDGLSYGYYVVSPQDGSTGNNNRGTTAMLVTLKEATYNIDLKSTYPTVDKTVVEGDKNGNHSDAQVGSKLSFTLTSSLPDLSEYERFNFRFVDTLSKGLTLDVDSIVVKIGQKQLTLSNDALANGHYTVAADSVVDTGETKLTVTLKNLVELVKDPALVGVAAGDPITVTYTATLNEDAVVAGAGNTNTAKVEWGTKGDADYSGTSKEDKTYTYTFDFKIKKVDENKAALAGAQFQVKTEGGQIVSVVAAEGPDGVLVVRPAILPADDAAKTDVVTTPASGLVTFQGFDAGTYKLVEVKAPDGYNKLADEIVVVITPAYGQDGTLTSYDVTFDSVKPDGGVFEIMNKKGILLPETGGIGTVLFTLGGAALIAYGVYRKRTAKTTA